MVKFLIIGDSHVPKRASEIPKQIEIKLEELAKSELFECTFFTGDEINYPEFMKSLSFITKKEVFRVIGNMDYYYGNKDAPIYQKLKFDFNNRDYLIIGITHGSQIQPRGDRSQLELFAIKKSNNILISGHTHKEEIFLAKSGILLLNPGSVTGAWSFVASRIPSFIVLNINKETEIIEVSLFQLDKKSEEVNEIKSFFKFENNKINYKY
ncbi:MAG: YfcE family phosphodiesterase [Candidatus Hodarchaeota archaeon]